MCCLLCLLLCLLSVSGTVRLQSIEQFVDVSNAKDSSIPPNLDCSSDFFRHFRWQFLCHKDERSTQNGRKGFEEFVSAVSFGRLQHFVGNVQQRQDLIVACGLQGVAPLIDGGNRGAIVVLHHGSRGALNGGSGSVDAAQAVAQFVRHYNTNNTAGDTE